VPDHDGTQADVHREVVRAGLADGRGENLDDPEGCGDLRYSTVVLVSVVGTQVTDILTDKLGVSLFVSTGVFARLKPSPSASVARSPAAVPSAKVRSMASQ
jgi:hypothetical protein